MSNLRKWNSILYSQNLCFSSFMCYPVKSEFHTSGMFADKADCVGSEDCERELFKNE